MPLDSYIDDLLSAYGGGGNPVLDNLRSGLRPGSVEQAEGVLNGLRERLSLNGPATAPASGGASTGSILDRTLPSGGSASARARSAIRDALFAGGGGKNPAAAALDAGLHAGTPSEAAGAISRLRDRLGGVTPSLEEVVPEIEGGRSTSLGELTEKLRRRLSLNGPATAPVSGGASTGSILDRTLPQGGKSSDRVLSRIREAIFAGGGGHNPAAEGLGTGLHEGTLAGAKGALSDLRSRLASSPIALEEVPEVIEGGRSTSLGELTENLRRRLSLNGPATAPVSGGASTGSILDRTLPNGGNASAKVLNSIRDALFAGGVSKNPAAEGLASGLHEGTPAGAREAFARLRDRFAQLPINLEEAPVAEESGTAAARTLKKMIPSLPEPPKAALPEAVKAVVPDAPARTLPDVVKAVVPDAPARTLPEAVRAVAQEAPRTAIPAAPKIIAQAPPVVRAPIPPSAPVTEIASRAAEPMSNAMKALIGAGALGSLLGGRSAWREWAKRARR